MTPVDTLSSAAPPVWVQAQQPNRTTIQANSIGYSSQDSLVSIGPKRAKQKQTEVKLAEKFALFLAASLVLSGVLFGMGHLLHSVARRVAVVAAERSGVVMKLLEMLSFLLKRSGEVGESAGRTLFLSLLVPPYILCYQLPKWLLFNRLPAVIRVISRWVTRITALVGQAG